jgi:MFS family permease
MRPLRSNGAIAGVALAAPLRRHDYATLWAGAEVSFLGDGVYFVAIAWQAYALRDTPAALALVGLAFTVPNIAFLLLGGALSDRFDRRRMLLGASLVQGIGIGAIALLSLAGELRVSMLLGLVALYGGAQAFVTPAFEAIVPTLVEPAELAAASALDQVGRRLALQILGPALGGVLVAFSSPGVALLLDAATFLAPMCAVAAIGPARRSSPREHGSLFADVRLGLEYARATPWLLGGLGAAALGLLAFYGPYQVLIAFLVKNRLHAGGGGFGLIQAAWGAGALVAALAVGQRGLPRRYGSLMYVGWALQAASLVAFGLAHSVLSFAMIALAAGACGAAGNVIWATLVRSLVPNELLGRVSALDWLASTSLIPVSFALVGPCAHALGAQFTLLGAGIIGAGSFLALTLIPSVRRPERHVVEAARAALHQTADY